MAEVDTWAAVDDDNDLAPPDGWPEGQMPSSVNNCGRAMMGAIRRMYDKIVNGTLALPYLPIAGGTVTGNVAINGTGGMTLSSTQLRNISNSLEVYNAAGGAISSRGPGAGLFFGDRDQVSTTWTWLANAGVAYLYDFDGAVLSVTGAGHLSVPSVSAAGAISGGNISAAGTITATGNIYAAGYYSDGVAVIDSSAGNTLIYKSGGGWGIQLQVSQSLYDNNSHVFRNASSVNTLTIDPAGNLVTAGNISSSSAYAEISANTAVIQTSIVCHGTIDAANYTRLGGPMFLITETQYNDITTRLENLEAQLKELSHV